ncbi:MAG: lytic transglycosylase domain-containing protein [Armatimonadetes bacterium]|nr:lytic transglycosylase domain-containing protein [Armatimonadota bacterium]
MQTAAPTPTSSGTRYEQVYYGNDAYLNAYRRVIRSYNPSLKAGELDTIVRSILYYSHLFRVDPRFVVAVVACESAFRPHAVSGAGAQGLGQLMPDTARELHVDPGTPYQNIQGTVRYLKLQLDRFKHKKKREQMKLALASYNAGYGAVTHYGGVPPYAETQNYVAVVLAEWSKLSGER